MKRFTFYSVMLFVVFGMIGQAETAIISVAGPPSTAGTSPVIILAPANALNSFAFNTGMEGFDEAQGVSTTVAHNIDGGGSIPAGVRVDSHMIFLNAQDGTVGISHRQVIWTFSRPIVGVMSDSGGNLEAASTFELGASGTNYTVGPPGQVAPYGARGMEGGDSYSVSGNMIIVNMGVSQPGDWIRVVTKHRVRAQIEIKPETLNLKSKGEFTAFIDLPDGYDEEDIDIDTVKCEGAPALKGMMADDGRLIVKFDRKDLVGVSAGAAVELIVTGKLTDGTMFAGSDIIRVIAPGKPAPSSRSRLSTVWGELKTK